MAVGLEGIFLFLGWRFRDQVQLGARTEVVDGPQRYMKLWHPRPLKFKRAHRGHDVTYSWGPGTNLDHKRVMPWREAVTRLDPERDEHPAGKRTHV